MQFFVVVAAACSSPPAADEIGSTESAIYVRVEKTVELVEDPGSFAPIARVDAQKECTSPYESYWVTYSNVANPGDYLDLRLRFVNRTRYVFSMSWRGESLGVLSPGGSDSLGVSPALGTRWNAVPFELRYMPEVQPPEGLRSMHVSAVHATVPDIPRLCPSGQNRVPRWIVVHDAGAYGIEPMGLELVSSEPRRHYRVKLDAPADLAGFVNASEGRATLVRGGGVMGWGDGLADLNPGQRYQLPEGTTLVTITRNFDSPTTFEVELVR